MKHLAKLYSAELDGINARVIEVEVDLNIGLHSFNIVGLADKALNEAKERVNSALKNVGIKPPTKENRRITVNLAPADIKKTGSQYDLAIALGYLLASEQIKKFETSDKIFVGELSLDGVVRPISGGLNFAVLTKNLGFKYLFLPKQNASEAALIDGVNLIPIESLQSLIDHLEERNFIEPVKSQKFEGVVSSSLVDISEIKGQESAKRALEVSAAGGHHILMSGPPGAGKTMMAQALLSLLPPPSLEESIEITKIWSSAAMLKDGGFINFRPFRNPHHTASPVSLVGGGQNPKPGEISLAHFGVLFLDELPEFRRDFLEALRQPLEAGMIQVSRAKGTARFPAKFMLTAAMNPCPCGYFGDSEKECRCSANEVFRYQKKISGPLLDRIDIQIDVPRVSVEELRNKNRDSKNTKIRDKISRARITQEQRLRNLEPKIRLNSEMSSKQVDENVVFDDAGENFLKNILEKSFISARGYYRILKVARTIADLEEDDLVSEKHLAESFQYRVREKE